MNRVLNDQAAVLLFVNLIAGAEIGDRVPLINAIDAGGTFTDKWPPLEELLK